MKKLHWADRLLMACLIISIFVGLAFFNSIMLIGWMGVLLPKKINRQPG